MKILIDARFYGLENAGLGRYTINLLKNLFTIDNDNIYIILLRQKYFKSLSVPNNCKKILADFKPYSFSEQFKLPFLIRSENPDLVHFVHFNAPIINFKPFVVTIHDMIMHKSKGMETTTLNPYLYFFKRIVYKFVFKNAVTKSKSILVPSETVKNEILKVFRNIKNKINVTYLGLDYKIIKPKYETDPKDKYLIYVGNAYPHKNLKKLIEAIKLAKIKLKISTSKNIFSKRLKNIIQDKKGEFLVELLGFVDDQKLVKLYQNALGFIYPSLIEGFGFQGLEAIASGTLLLASDISVFKEIYKNNCFYFDPTSPVSISNAIKKVTSISDVERLKIIEKGQEFIKKYSWLKCTKQTLKIYNSI